MLPDKFKNIVESQLKQEMSTWTRKTIMSVIKNTIQLTLQYPEDAKFYCNYLHRDVIDTSEIMPDYYNLDNDY